MAFDLGAVVPLTWTPAAGVDNAAVTVTLPDGTAATPTVTGPTDGVYSAPYTTTGSGRHTVRWIGTGSTADAFTDVFDVAPATSPWIISLTEAKNQLNITSTTHDTEIRGFIGSATRIVEHFIGRVAVQTCNEVCRGGAVLLLSNLPVMTVTSVEPVYLGRLSYDPSDLDIDPPTGVVRHKRALCFEGPLRVTYTAGRLAIEDNWSQAAKIIVQHLWQTQRGGSRRPSMGQSDDIIEQQLVAVMGYAIPRRAVELLQPDEVTGIA